MNALISSLEKELYDFYRNFGVSDRFKGDFIYLANAYDEIEKLWLKQFTQMQRVKYIMLSEAPLFGEKKSYIYNEDAPQTQFFYFTDVQAFIGSPINSKQELFEALSRSGLIILDIFPFAFNDTTALQYSKFSKGKNNGYKSLFDLTYPKYFRKKLDLILSKAIDPVICFYRYDRVKENVHEILMEKLSDDQDRLILKDAPSISQPGGGIDRVRLKEIITG
ncbi:MAG TPA: hypothetical protein VHY08_11235 [Bacillota bacterium]|nr:hypothetical protein [Bacillota bacterium]